MTDALTAAVLLFASEIGDKSQLVCMALATQLPASRVWMGAVLAFMLLNGIAVVVGAAAASFLNPLLVLSVSGLVFLAFGAASLWTYVRGKEQELPQLPEVLKGNPVVATTSVIMLAELGDKTQFAVAALSTVQDPGWTWFGATIAVSLASALAVTVGSWLLPKLPRDAVLLVSGALFMAAAGWQWARAFTYLS